MPYFCALFNRIHNLKGFNIDECRNLCLTNFKNDFYNLLHIMNCEELFNKSFSENIFIYSSNNFIFINLLTPFMINAITVSKEDAFLYAKRAAREEGIFQGISSGATMAALAKKLPEIPAGSRILIFNYDTGERYLSIEGLFE